MKNISLSLAKSLNTAIWESVWAQLRYGKIIDILGTADYSQFQCYIGLDLPDINGYLDRGLVYLCSIAIDSMEIDASALEYRLYILHEIALKLQSNEILPTSGVHIVKRSWVL